MKNSERKITNHLQQDVVKVSDKTIFINPFLYWRRFDENTNRWLREPGQMSEDQISPNRNRFYPEIEWADLSNEQKLIKDATVEMFLKTLELISTFHPYLSSGQLLEVERKMAIIKKIPFEKWVTKSFAKKARLLENEKLFNNQLNFDVHLIKLDCSSSWVENKIIDTFNLLRSDVFPKPSLNCEYCNYLKKRWQLSIT